jgi:hypothetical protein
MATKRHDGSNITKANAARAELTHRVKEFLDALEALGILRHACDAVGIPERTVSNWMAKDPSLKERIAIAHDIGKAKRKDYLEALAYEMAPKNPTMVMFLLKREDPSYRESYNVNSTSQPTNYVIDLWTP